MVNNFVNDLIFVLCHTPKYVVYAEIFKIKLEGLGVRGEGGGGREEWRRGGNKIWISELGPINSYQH